MRHTKLFDSKHISTKKNLISISMPGIRNLGHFHINVHVHVLVSVCVYVCVFVCVRVLERGLVSQDLRTLFFLKNPLEVNYVTIGLRIFRGSSQLTKTFCCELLRLSQIRRWKVKKINFDRLTVSLIKGSVEAENAHKWTILPWNKCTILPKENEIWV